MRFNISDFSTRRFHHRMLLGLSSIMLPNAPERHFKRDQDNSVPEASLNWQLIHVEAYIVYVDMVSRHEVAYKLIEKTVDALIKGLEKEGADELLYDGSEKVKQAILSLMKPLLPPHPSVVEAVRLPKLLPSPPKDSMRMKTMTPDTPPTVEQWIARFPYDHSSKTFQCRSALQLADPHATDCQHENDPNNRKAQGLKSPGADSGAPLMFGVRFRKSQAPFEPAKD
ncbi:hypothetical protein MRS44_018185 [Fusarium solani]|uniref:uncharacterized protein n=1 Tax=Fusarium solani TaxID=169388 RepID=UPI0032C3F1A1|nr:hypothetical protein MRS44_018185 [Fusarium solani]